MGRQKAASLILAGDRMTPQELESAGLITKILPKENFLEQVMQIARRVAAQPVGALKVNSSFRELLFISAYHFPVLEEPNDGTNPTRTARSERERMSGVEGERSIGGT